MTDLVITECKCEEFEKSIRPWNENTASGVSCEKSLYITWSYILHRAWTWRIPKKRSFRQQCIMVRFVIFILFNILLVVDSTITWTGALPTLHATHVNWFIKVKSHFQKLPNCTVALSKFQKFSWGGAHRAPQTPPPDFTRRFVPRFRASRGLGALRLGACFNICTARKKIQPTPLICSIVTSNPLCYPFLQHLHLLATYKRPVRTVSSNLINFRTSTYPPFPRISPKNVCTHFTDGSSDLSTQPNQFPTSDSSPNPYTFSQTSSILVMSLFKHILIIFKTPDQLFPSI